MSGVGSMLSINSYLVAAIRTLRRTIGGAHSRNGHGDRERAQAIVRLLLTSLVALYLVAGVVTGAVSRPIGSFLAAYFIVFLVVSTILLVAILRRPGVNHYRRAIAMALDFGSLTMTMIIGSEYVAPLYAILLWVTVGYGMRYGPRYLGTATLLALTSLGFIVLGSSYWQEQPYIVAALAVTTIIVPLYAHMLLTDTREASDLATAANLAKSRFLAQASHDLRQPVHAIGLFTACLRASGLAPDDKQMVDNIDRSLQSLSRLFRSLLDVATLDSGKISPNMQVVAVGPLIKSIVDQNTEAARWANADLRFVRTNLRVRADPNLLTIILQNLLSNALKYAPDAPVLIGCRRSGNSLSIHIHDCGQGISEQDRSNVFEEFYRVSVPGKDVEGVGLGLSIVRRMATLMDLGVILESSVDRGTSVAITGLKITQEEETSRILRPNPPASLISGMKILLIEDDADVLTATKTMLEKWGCQVNAQQTAQFDVEPCDLLLADFDLNGDESGVECIARVRSLLGRDIPAIIMTGHSDGRVQAEIGSADIPILSKPTRPAELRAAILARKLQLEQLDNRSKPRAIVSSGL